jgi:SAM-dependent methyltransferase
MLTEARRRARAARLDGRPGGRIGWVLGDAARLPFPDGGLDAVTGHSFLYLLPDRAAALAEMRRVLRPGGRVILMEPHARPAGMLRAALAARDPRHLLAVGLWRPFSRVHGRYTRASLAATLEGAGFGGVRVEEALGGLGLLAVARRQEAGA